MTRGPKSGGNGGGSGAGDARTHSGKTHLSKPIVAKPLVTKPLVTKPPSASAPAKLPVITKPVAGTPAAKRPFAARKTAAAKMPAARSSAAKTDALSNSGNESASPNSNGHGKARVAQPGGPPHVPRKANRRSAARLAAVQALYQMDITGAGLNEILAQFESHWLGREVEGEQYLPAEAAFFRDIVSGVVDVQRDLDPRIDAALEATWPLKRIEAILRSVLRAGAYELQKRTDIPARVVVSEYVDVAHAFVDKTETGMVNAVLDRLARNVRAAEFR